LNNKLNELLVKNKAFDSITNSEIDQLLKIVNNNDFANKVEIITRTKKIPYLSMIDLDSKNIKYTFNDILTRFVQIIVIDDYLINKLFNVINNVNKSASCDYILDLYQGLYQLYDSIIVNKLTKNKVDHEFLLNFKNNLPSPKEYVISVLEFALLLNNIQIKFNIDYSAVYDAYTKLNERTYRDILNHNLFFQSYFRIIAIIDVENVCKNFQSYYAICVLIDQLLDK
jgi:hypothetical protein